MHWNVFYPFHPEVTSPHHLLAAYSFLKCADMVKSTCWPLSEQIAFRVSTKLLQHLLLEAVKAHSIKEG